MLNASIMAVNAVGTCARHCKSKATVAKTRSLGAVRTEMCLNPPGRRRLVHHQGMVLYLKFVSVSGSKVIPSSSCKAHAADVSGKASQPGRSTIYMHSSNTQTPKRQVEKRPCTTSTWWGRIIARTQRLSIVLEHPKLSNSLDLGCDDCPGLCEF